MKNSKVLWAFSLCIFFYGATISFSQETAAAANKSDIKIKEHTLMERFAPDLVIPANERLAMKIKRREDAKLKLAILDTLQVSNRKKRQLLHDIKYSPFSDRLDKAIIVDTSFEDDNDK